MKMCVITKNLAISSLYINMVCGSQVFVLLSMSCALRHAWSPRIYLTLMVRLNFIFNFNFHVNEC